jgi:hypothetical protein
MPNRRGVIYISAAHAHVLLQKGDVVLRSRSLSRSVCKEFENVTVFRFGIIFLKILYET